MSLLTKRERQIMEIFWKADEALSVSEVIDHDKELSKNTVAAVVKKLFSKDLLTISGIGYTKTALTRQYIPTVSEEQFFSQELSDKALSKLVANFIDSTNNLESLDALEKQIADRKNSLNKGSD